MSRTIGNQNFVDDSDKAPDITFILKTPQSDILCYIEMIYIMFYLMFLSVNNKRKAVHIM